MKLKPLTDGQKMVLVISASLLLFFGIMRWLDLDLKAGSSPVGAVAAIQATQDGNPHCTACDCCDKYCPMRESAK